MAPELFEADGRISYASDVYAFGMSMYGVLAKETPFR
jgi:serine/threonine protein kinase